MKIPDELLTEYKRGRVLVFIGNEINGDEWNRLGIYLAGRLEKGLISEAGSVPEIAEEYQIANGTHSLIHTIRDFYEKQGQIHPGYRLLAAMDKSRIFVTTCIDEHLEHAFEESGREIDVIIRQSDRAYAGERRLYKLHGTIGQPETLRLTEQEIQQCYDHDESFSIVLKGQLADNTILFVGFALDDPFFQQLYRNSIARLHRHMRRAYALGGPYSRKVERFCQTHQIALIRYEPVDFLSNIIESAEASPPTKSSDKKRVIPPNIRPYKKLYAYGPDDEWLFFGRRHETETLLSLVQAHPLVILHGASGMGKSSLLGAGLTPCLTDTGYTVITIRAESKIPPDTLIRRQISILFPEESPLASDLPFEEYLIHACKQFDTALVIILDQFEDFFISSDGDIRAGFTAELAKILSNAYLPIKWVFAIRSEWFSALSEMRAYIRDIFKAEFRLKPLTASETRKAIEMPAQCVNMSCEPELSERLLQDLGQESIQLPQLQLVCDALYDAARGSGYSQLRLTEYRAIGGAEGVLNNYLYDFLKKFPTDYAKQFRIILNAFVTSEKTVIPLTIAELAEITGIADQQIANLLRELQDERLISSVDRGPDQPFAYQLAHSYLVRTLTETPESLKQKAINELLRQEIAHWQRFGTLMSGDKLDFIRCQQSDIELPETAHELIFRSAIQNNNEIAYWIGQMKSQEMCARVITEHLTHEKLSHSCPLTALSAISDLPDKEPFKPLLTKIIFDAAIEPELRRKASLTLAGSDEDYFLTSIESVSDTSPESRHAVLEAIASVWQTGVEIVTGSRLARFKLKWPLRRLRLKQNRSQIIRTTLFTMFGGACGAAVGGLIGWLLSNIPLILLPNAVNLAGWNGILIGLGTGFGISTIDAMGEHKISLLSLFTAAIIPGLLYMLLGSMVLNDFYRQAYNMAVNLLIGCITGISVSLIVYLGRRIPSLSRRLRLGAIMGIPIGIVIGGLLALKMRFGLVFAYTPEKEKILINAPYGFGIGLIMAIGTIVGLELGKHKKQ